MSVALPQLVSSPTVPGRIHRVGFVWINLGGRIFEQDRILHPEGVSGPWWRDRRHWFLGSEIEALHERYRPELIVLGAGWMGMMRTEASARETAAELGIRLEEHRTDVAAGVFQRAFSAGVRVVGAFHLTC